MTYVRFGLFLADAPLNLFPTNVVAMVMKRPRSICSVEPTGGGDAREIYHMLPLKVPT